MTTLSIYTKLVSVVSGSSGITRAVVTAPATINAADLPLAVVRDEEGRWHPWATGSYKRHDQDYIIDVYVNPVAQGVGLDEGFQAVFAPMDALGRTFLNNLSLDDTVDKIADIRTRRAILTFGEVTFHGFTCRITVTEKGT